MLFHSLLFLGVFLPLTYLIYWKLRGKTQRYQWLAITGCAFYAVWNYKFCVLLVMAMLLTYLAGVGLSVWHEPWRRRLCAAVPVAGGLFLLGFFKFTTVWLDTANSLAHDWQLAVDLPHLSLMVPLGLSWYVAGMVIYVIETYTGRIQPTRNFWEFACQITFFPKLIAGPIARFWQTDADLKNLDQAERNSNLRLGLSFFALGMIQKVLIADTLAGVIDPALAHYRQLSTAGAWMCMLGYTYQFYFDCAGYFDMAVGLGHMFGIRLPQNFNSPYQAVDIRDFWRRWNITISAVLRDFIYFPLGGSRGGASDVPQPDDYDGGLRDRDTVPTGRSSFGAPIMERCWPPITWRLGKWIDFLVSSHVVTFGLIVIGWVFSAPTTCRWHLPCCRPCLPPRGGPRCTIPQLFVGPRSVGDYCPRIAQQLAPEPPLGAASGPRDRRPVCLLHGGDLWKPAECLFDMPFLAVRAATA